MQRLLTTNLHGRRRHRIVMMAVGAVMPLRLDRVVPLPEPKQPPVSPAEPEKAASRLRKAGTLKGIWAAQILGRSARL